MTSKRRAEGRNWITWALLGVLLATLVVGTGCRSRSGSREFIPGRGWVPND
jgi:hypothetical protein